MQTKPDRLRIAAISDVHYDKRSEGMLRPLFVEIAEKADVLVICGDLTDTGLPEEARILVADLAPVLRMPVLAVMGNHDFHSGRTAEVDEVLSAAGVRVLDGETFEIQGVGFAGVKGFMGGFGRRLLEPWGEDTVKLLVQEAVAEAVKLEQALARLRTPHLVALLHYAPIEATVAGEPEQIFPFLGCSRLEEPLNRHPVNVVFHGHAHHGQPEGRTTRGVPVYNVSHSLLKRAYPERAPFRIFEIPLSTEAVPVGAT